MFRALAHTALIGVATAGTILWDGRFKLVLHLNPPLRLCSLTKGTAVWPPVPTSIHGLGVIKLDHINTTLYADTLQVCVELLYWLKKHGSEAVTSYVNLDPSYKNPADSGSTQGVKITLDSTAYWNGQTMRRTELIPQTTAPINSGTVYYHFSIMHSATNAPSLFKEHQICFFESHFTEMKAGWISGEAGTSDPLLRWDVNSATHWNTTFTAGVWHNVAYEIVSQFLLAPLTFQNWLEIKNFSSGSVAYWHSTGSDPLTLTVPAVAVGASSNGADWHLGVLELPRSGYPDTNEDLYFSGVYVESGSLTTSVAGPGGVVISQSSVPASPTTITPSSSTSTPVVISTPTPTQVVGTVAEYGQVCTSSDR